MTEPESKCGCLELRMMVLARLEQVGVFVVYTNEHAVAPAAPGPRVLVFIG